MDRLLELLERPRIEAEPGQVELQRILVEDAEDGLLAEDRGQHRHPEVDLARAVAQLDAAVLGQPALGDVKVRHDLEPRDDRGLEPLGRCQQLVQDAVDAEPDAKRLLVGLPVDVDRKSTRLNSSHRCISYAVFCLKKKTCGNETGVNHHNAKLFATGMKGLV